MTTFIFKDFQGPGGTLPHKYFPANRQIFLMISYIQVLVCNMFDRHMHVFHDYQ